MRTIIASQIEKALVVVATVAFAVGCSSTDDSDDDSEDSAEPATVQSQQQPEGQGDISSLPADQTSQIGTTTGGGSGSTGGSTGGGTTGGGTTGGSEEVPDTTAPSVSNTIITVDSYSDTSVSISWAAGSDDITDVGSLEYQVYRSTSANIATLGDLSNGTVVAAWSSNKSFSDTGLSEDTSYTYNVVVRDEVGNKTAYNQQTQKTADLVSTTWTFTNGANYTFGSAVSVGSGLATLVAIDQVDDDNTSSGFGSGSHISTEWNAGNSAIQLQASQSSGEFTSRILDAGGVVNWSNIAWTAHAPYGKELPSGTGNESGNYAAGAIDMTNAVLNIGFNESAGATSFTDRSSQAHTATCDDGSGFCPVSGGVGKLSTGVTFDGSNDIIVIPDHDSLDDTDKLSISVWVYPTTLDSLPRAILSKRTGASNNQSYSLFFYTGAKLYVDIDASNDRISTNKVFTTNTWYHIGVVYDGTLSAANRVSIYVNGVLDKTGSESSASIPNYASDLYIGMLNANYGAPKDMAGTVDELAIWKGEAFDATTIQSLYERGAYRIKHQVRECNVSDCSDGTWVGPGGSGGAYYSELNNSGIDQPSVALTGLSGSTRYFQYRSTLESDDSVGTPRLESGTIGPAHLDASTPSITTNSGVAYDDLRSVAVSTGGGHTGTITVQLSPNGSDWYWYTGGAWAVASGSSQSNTVSEVNSGASLFAGQTGGSGTLYIRAWLESDLGTQTVELDQIDVTTVTY